MASADYRLCDLCGAKAFYDAELNYHQKEAEYDVPYREVGVDQYADQELNEKSGMCVGYVGDWAVLCINCAKTHKTQIVEIENTKTEEVN